MKIERQQLVEAMDCVKAGLCKGKETVIQGAHFVFMDKKLYTFNDEVMCCYPIDVGFEGAVLAKPFLDLVNKYSSEYVDLTVDDRGLTVTGGRRRVKLAVEKKILLPIKDIPYPEEWHEIDPMLQSRLGLAASCVADDAPTFIEQCVHLDSGFVEAYGGEHMVRGFCSTPGYGVLVRGSAVKPVEGLDVEYIAVADEWLVFKCISGMLYYVRRYATDDYPVLGPLFFPDKEEHIAEFNAPQGLEDALSALMVVFDNATRPYVNVSLGHDKMVLKYKTGQSKFMEKLDSSYDGEHLTFAVDPKVLKWWTANYAQGVLTKRALRFETEDEFVYMTCLCEPDPEND